MNWLFDRRRFMDLNFAAALFHGVHTGGFDILDILVDAGIDSLKMLPFLYAAFLFMEYFEHKAGDKLANALKKMGNFGSVGGALLGCIPQCGFSVAAANLYAGEMITAGTLLAVFLSTSDEAVPIMLAHPDKAGAVWKLLLIKVIIAAAAGFIMDIILKIISKKRREEPFADICTDCGCGEHGIFYSAFKHTLNIFIFILIVNIVLNGIIGFVGEETFSHFLTEIKTVQPFVAGLVGMIPNCAASVVITELFVQGSITAGSAVAGLCTGAGVGLVVLFKTNKNLKENITILAVLYIVGVLSGLLVDLLGITII